MRCHCINTIRTQIIHCLIFNSTIAKLLAFRARGNRSGLSDLDHGKHVGIDEPSGASFRAFAERGSAGAGYPITGYQVHGQPRQQQVQNAMKQWSFAARNSMTQERIRRDEHKLRLDFSSGGGGGHTAGHGGGGGRDKVPVYREEEYARPGTVLRNKLQRFRKNSRHQSTLTFGDRVAESQDHTKESASTFDRREARRIGRVALEHVDIFKGLPIGRLAELLKFTTFRAGDELISQGIVGRHLYIVLEGSVSICVGETQVATKRVGTILGERSMIFKSLTTATCRAKGRVRCAFLTRTVFLDNCSPALIKMLEHRCRMQDVLSQNGQRSYEHLDTAQQHAVFNRIHSLCHRLIRDQGARYARRLDMRARCHYLWQRARALALSKIIRSLPSFRAVKDAATLLRIGGLLRIRTAKKGEKLYVRGVQGQGCLLDPVRVVSGAAQNAAWWADCRHAGSHRMPRRGPRRLRRDGTAALAKKARGRREHGDVSAADEGRHGPRPPQVCRHFFATRQRQGVSKDCVEGVPAWPWSSGGW